MINADTRERQERSTDPVLLQGFSRSESVTTESFFFTEFNTILVSVFVKIPFASRATKKRRETSDAIPVTSRQFRLRMNANGSRA